ncbi:MAG: GNAT family N-acetyltransferase [Bacteroidia bacterium]|nr:GNAT family N-acetyltransferase [Bacteroidia bacterium]
MHFDFTTDIQLEDERVRIEPLGLEHLDDFAQVAKAHPNLLQYFPAVLRNRDDALNYITEAIWNRSATARYPFALLDKPSNQYVGSTSFYNISNKDLRLEIGWTWLSPHVQRTGFNRRVKLLMLQYAFDQLGFERVALRTDGRNTQSQKAILGIGAQFEGRLRSHITMPNGYRRDTMYYSILKEEWPEIQRRLRTQITPETP